jgi:hypothetical protein
MKGLICDAIGAAMIFGIGYGILFFGYGFGL